MKDDRIFAGAIADTDDAFIQAVVRLYTNQDDAWYQAHEKCNGYINPANRQWQHEYLGVESRWPYISEYIATTLLNLKTHCQTDFVRALLWREESRSTEYVAKYIEQKEHVKELLERQQQLRQPRDEPEPE